LGKPHQRTLNSNNSPFKYNGKEFDEETGNYYYGARYYDPKLSIFISVDPLADKYPGMSPYAYCLNNPINLIDPTGMEGENPDGDPTKKNIFIVLDFNPKDSGDHIRDKIEFADMEKNGWHGIYAQNLQDAEKQTKEYLKGTQADNILIQTHGGHNGDDRRVMWTDNNAGHSLSSNDFKNFTEGNITDMGIDKINDIYAYAGIISSIKEGGTLTNASCFLGQDDNFFGYAQELSCNRINMFASQDLCTPYSDIKSKPGTAIFSGKAISRSYTFTAPDNVRDGWKYYPQNYKIGNLPDTSNKNVGINTKGFFTLKK